MEQMIDLLSQSGFSNTTHSNQTNHKDLLQQVVDVIFFLFQTHFTLW
jgi:hypothetical protein